MPATLHTLSENGTITCRPEHDPTHGHFLEDFFAIEAKDEGGTTRIEIDYDQMRKFVAMAFAAFRVSESGLRIVSDGGSDDE